MSTVVVTGGTTRLGKAIAGHLRAIGWLVITTSHRPDAGADVVADLSDPMGAARLYSAVMALNGGMPPDALVNNAALFAGDAETLEMVNVSAPEKLTMMMAGRESGRGAVVNVLDAAVADDPQPTTPYAIGKRALWDYTVRSAGLFVDTLRVNGVAPGPVMVPEGVRVKAMLTPLGRPTAEAVAKAVAYLLAADFTTGCIIPVSGCAG